MILKKPYAFLIKHFKGIHLILSLLMIYIAYKINNILNFVKGYINNSVNPSLATNYIGPILFISVLVVIGILLSLYILMRYKKKPKLLYLINILIYSTIFFALFYLLLSFQTIERELADPKTIRFIRDIIRIILYPEYICILFMVIRTLGFDIKRFEFKSDIKELDIDVTDNEEIELEVGIDTEKIKRRGRRQLRELKYYVLENKFFVFTILGITLFSIITLIVYNFLVVNKVYKEGEVVDTMNFKVVIEDSYITKKNDYGNTISSDDNYFVIIKINVKSKLSDSTKYKLSPNKFLLIVGDNSYVPDLKQYNNFKLIGVGYKNQILNSNDFDEYILVYNIQDSEMKEKMYIKYDDVINNDIKSKKIKINLKDLDEVELENTYNLNDIIDLNNSILKGNLKFTSFDINDTFLYEYNYCVNSYCEQIKNNITSSDKGNLLKLVVENNIEKLSTYDLSNNFINLKYTIEGKEYTGIIENKTPATAKTDMYFEIHNNVVNADNIWLEIVVRDKLYKYILK